MKLTKTLFVLLCAAFVTQSLYAQQRWDEIDFPPLRDYEIPEVETLKGDNGAKYFLVEDKELPLITIYVLVRTGEILVPDDQVGLASVTGTVMRSGGTETISSDSLNVILENNAASIETGIGFSNGRASLSVLKEDLDDLLPVLVDVLRNPAFPQEKIDLALKQRRTGISRRNDDPSQIISREYEQLIYGENSVYGRLTEYSTLANITREDLVSFHDKHFKAPNFYVAAVGDFDQDEMSEKLNKAFSVFEGGSETEIVFPEIKKADSRTINLINKNDVNQSSIQLGHLGTTRNEDYAALQVMNEILSGGFSGRLMQRIRTDLGLAYGVYGSYNQYVNYPGTFSSGVKTKIATTKQTIDAIIKEIERIQDEEVSDEELAETKDRFLNSLVFEYDSDEKVLFEQLNNAYSGLPEDTFEEFVENVKEVTTDDIQRVAREYLHPERFQILVLSNKEELGDQLDDYGDVNMIDITIPQPGAAAGSASADAPKGDAKQGAKMLGEMANAVMGDNSDPKTVVKESAVTQFNERLPNGKMTTNSTSTFTFPDKLVVEISTPMGNQEINIDGNTGKMSMGQRSMDLQAPQIKNFMEGIYSGYMYIAAKSDEIDAEYMGAAEMKGSEYIHLKVNGAKKLDVYLDTETHLPAYVSYEQFNAQSGSNSKVVTELSNWTEANGLTFAKKEVTTVDGEVIADGEVKSVSVE